MSTVLRILYHLAAPLMLIGAAMCALSLATLWQRCGLMTPLLIGPVSGLLVTLLSYRTVARHPFALAPVPLPQMAAAWLMVVAFGVGVMVFVRHLAAGE
jgi:hypothetical protein